MSEGRSTILVLHPSSTDPTSFLQPSSPSTSTGHAETSDMGASTSYSSASVPWDIENKYYTASVTFGAYPQEIYEVSKAEGVDVVMYLFEGSLNSLPAGLVKVMANPRDIGLAIRLKSNAGVMEERSDESERERMEDLFDEIGMEYMDESSLPEDDDERPISIEERIRQTLMTHMWPNMIRKPIQSRMDMGFEDDDEEDYNVGREDIEDDNQPEFPVTFNPLQSQAPTNDLSESANPDDFPGLEELKSQIMLEDLDKLQDGSEGHGMNRLGFSRLDMMDDDDDDDFDAGDGGDWVGAEYAKLDDWLEEDDDDQRPHQLEDEDLNEDTTRQRSTTEPPDEEIDRSMEPVEEESQFEDDFADFAPFQSAPAPRPSGSVGADALDPTPLLLHLQNVREELAGLDEDTRRERAGREVESVLQSLGLGGLGGVEWEDDLGDEV